MFPAQVLLLFVVFFFTSYLHQTPEQVGLQLLDLHTNYLHSYYLQTKKQPGNISLDTDHYSFNFKQSITNNRKQETTKVGHNKV